MDLEQDTPFRAALAGVGGGLMETARSPEMYYGF